MVRLKVLKTFENVLELCKMDLAISGVL
jgi:hypothetical protein